MPYCTNCGTEEQDGQQFCGVCGTRKPGSFGAMPMPSMSSATFGSDAEVRVGISLGSTHQSRWSILFRAILVVPLYLVVLGVGFASFFVTIAAWFCALFTGRVPDSQQRFLTNALRVYGNVLAYWYLLSRRWPGITFNAKPDDQVSIDIDHVRLRRWSVFFRFVLVVPATIVSNAVYLGSIPLLLVAWVWGVVAGQESRPIHQTLALILRYQLRLQAYWSLLTPTQPFRGFLGDGDEPSSKTSGGGVATPSSTINATFPSRVDPIEAQRSLTSTATMTTLSTRWFVTKAAKVLMVLVLVAGALLYFLMPTFESPLIVRMQDFVSRGVVTTSHTVTLNVMRRFETSTGGCRGTYMLECQQRAATLAYPRLSEQSTLLLSNNIFVPSNALTFVKKYELALGTLEFELLTVQSSSSIASQSRVVKFDVPATLSQVNRDFNVAEARLGA